jgi:hypothetical protein
VAVEVKDPQGFGLPVQDTELLRAQFTPALLLLFVTVAVNDAV